MKATEAKDALDFGRALKFVRRRWTLIAACSLAFLGLGIAYLFVATPRYTASVSLLVESGPAVGRVISELATAESPAREDSFLYSQLEILRSDQISAVVAQDLKLTENAAFLAADRKLSRALWQMLTGSPEAGGTPLQTAVRVLQAGLGTSRLQRTRILQAAFTHRDKDLAAAIAQQYAVVFLRDRERARSEAMRQAGSWLQGTLDDLRQQAVTSDHAVETYKAVHGLTSVSGRIVSDQLLLQLNDQLVTARLATEDARAKVDSTDAVLASGQPDTLPEGLGGTVLATLRERYLEAAQALLVATRGDAATSPPGLDLQARTLKDQILQELKRVSLAQRNALSLAEAREKSLRDSVAAATAMSATASLSKVELRELERASENYRALYASTLQRLQESRQQESFPVVDVRIFRDAAAPLYPSSPRKLLVITLALVGGALFGGGVAMAKEVRDGSFRNAGQVRERLGLPVLGMLPPLARNRRASGPDPAASPLVSDALAAVLRAVPSPAADRPAVIGVVSAFANEGRSEVALALASHLADRNTRTTLVGAQPPAGAGSGAAEPAADAGHRPLTQLPPTEAGLRHWLEHDMAGLAEAGSQAVVLDMPPLVRAGDVADVCGHLHGLVLVVAWGRSDQILIRRMLEQHTDLARRCIGVVLTNVDLKRLALYEETPVVTYLRMRARPA